MNHRPSKRGDVELTRQLIMAGRDIGPPPPDALQRTLARVEIAAAAGLLTTDAVASQAAAATAQVKAASLVGSTLVAPAKGFAGFGGSGVVAKWFISGLLVGIAGGGAMTVAAVHVTSNAETSLIATQPRAPTATRPPLHPSKSLEAIPGDTPIAHPGAPDPASNPGELRQVSPKTTRTLAQPSPDRSPELARELSMLDEARAALERGDPQESLRALERHRREFPNGQLMPEADLLQGRANAQLAVRAQRSVPAADVSR